MRFLVGSQTGATAGRISFIYVESFEVSVLSVRLALCCRLSIA